MIDPLSRQSLSKRLRPAVATVVEMLEARAYLTGVVLGTPINTATAPLGLSPVFVNMADFNGDHKGDLFVANSNNTVSVLTGNGDGTFQTPVNIPVSGSPLPLATGMLTSSGHLDIVAGTSGSPGDVSIILGNGNGTFQAANNIPALANNQAIAIADFNNDGNNDIITVSGSATPTNNAEVILGNGAGGELQTATPFSLPFGNVAAVGVGDFNGDGNQDIAVVNEVNNSVSILFGNGNGAFQAPQTYATGPTPTSIIISNFRNRTLSNGKPELDIVTADSTGGEVSFLGNNGDGTFAAAVNSGVSGSATGGGPLKVRLTDFNGDGTPDLLVLDSAGSSADATVLLGNGDGTFHTGALIATHGSTRTSIAAGDLNGDGLTDAVVANSGQLTSLLNITNQDTSAPTAVVNSTQVAASSLNSTYNFTVTYSDAQQIDAATIATGNLVVTAPAGVTFPGGATTETATLVSRNLGNAATVQATYQISFGSNLTSADNGAYSVAINANSVKNANGTPVPAGTIGSFTLSVQNVDVTPPTAAVDTLQTPASNTSSVYDFTVTYTDNVAVNASTIGNNNLVVTFPGGTRTQNATLISTNLQNGPTVQATYQITFSSNLTTANNGGYTVTLNANSVKDTSGNAAVGGGIGTFTLNVQNPDTVPPTASVNSTQTPPSTVSNTYDFVVTYTDNVLVDASTLGNGNLTVTLPGGGTTNPTLVSTGLTNAAVVQATYRVTFSSNISSANNGTYQVAVNANSVKDTSGNAVAAGNIGSFPISVNTVVPPSGDFAVSAPTGRFTASVVSGSKQKGGATVIITYNGTATVTKATVTTTLYASLTNIHDGTSIQVGAPVTKKVGKLKPGKVFKIHFAPFTYPSAAGSYYLVSDVALNGTLDSFDGATPTPINVRAAFIDAIAVTAAPIKTTLSATKKNAAFITVQNAGNIVTPGPATVDVAVAPAAGGSATTIATAVPVTIRLQPGVSKKFRVNFSSPSLPASGTYNLILTVHIAGDTVSTNDSAVSTATVTI